MDRPRYRFTLRKALIAVALAGLLCGLIRAGSGATAWAILGVCTILVAALWFADALATRRERGFETSRVRRLGLALTALASAVLVVGLSNIAFFVAFRGATDFLAERSPHGLPYYDDPVVIFNGSAYGLIIGLLTAFALRQALWPQRGSAAKRMGPLQRYGPLIALGLLALLYVGCRLV